MRDGYVRGWPRLLLRLEGACILLCALAGYARSGPSWWMFAALILVPDASMLGYLVNPRVGATAYNLAHTLTVPLLLLCLGIAGGSGTIATGLALIWLAHIGIDRAAGYGLKYVGGFGDTHLGPIGRGRGTVDTRPRRA